MLKYSPKLWKQITARVAGAIEEVPRIPITHPTKTGCWQKYNLADHSWSDCTLRPNSIYCTDVETVSANRFLALASAYDLVDRCWYAWLTAPGADELIEFPPNTIGIAHRANFENAFTANGYSDTDQVKWLCTHSMANALLHPTDLTLFRAVQHNDGQYNGWASFMAGGADTSLAGLHRHFTRREMDKSQVQVFIKGEREEFRDCLEECFKYNFVDVQVTILIFWRMWEQYQKYSSVFTTGLMLRACPRLSLESDFDQQILELDRIYWEKVAVVEATCAQIQADHLLSGDQGWDGLDWSVKKSGQTRWVDKEIRPGKKTFASIARLRWAGKPLKLVPVYQGLIPKQVKFSKVTRAISSNLSTKKFQTAKSKIVWTETQLIEKFSDRWHQLEQEDGQTYEEACQLAIGEFLDNPNNTNPKSPKHIVSFFTKGFLPFWEDGQLTSDLESVRGLVVQVIAISFWKQIRMRLLNLRSRRVNDQTYICPLTSPNGTVTGRAIDPVWLVLAKFEKGKHGSDLLKLVQAGKDRALVYADFDSCQTLIAALISDSYAHWAEMGTGLGKILASEFSIAALTGNKKDESTLPYVLAKKANQPYAKGKNSLYSLLFFVGLAKLGIMMGSQEVADKLEKAFRGTRLGKSNNYDGMGMAHNYYRAVETLADGYSVDKGQWTLSADTEMFTSFLRRKLPKTLQASIRDKSKMLTAYNAQIQAVDQDMLNYVTALITETAIDQGIWLRLETCVHDALCFEVDFDNAQKLAEIFQMAHRRMMEEFIDNLGLDPATFPVGCWEYSSVDIMKNWSTNKDYEQVWDDATDDSDNEEATIENILIENQE